MSHSDYESFSTFASLEQLHIPSNVALGERRNSGASVLSLDSAETSTLQSPATPICGGYSFISDGYTGSDGSFEIVQHVDCITAPYGPLLAHSHAEYQAMSDAAAAAWLPGSIPEYIITQPHGLKPSPMPDMIKCGNALEDGVVGHHAVPDQASTVKVEHSPLTPTSMLTPSSMDSDPSEWVVDSAMAGYMSNSRLTEAENIAYMSPVMTDPTISPWEEIHVGSDGHPTVSPAETIMHNFNPPHKHCQSDLIPPDMCLSSVEIKPSLRKRTRASGKSRSVLSHSRHLLTPAAIEKAANKANEVQVCGKPFLNQSKAKDDRHARFDKETGKWVCTRKYHRAEHLTRHYDVALHKRKLVYCPWDKCKRSRAMNEHLPEEDRLGFEGGRRDNVREHFKKTHCQSSSTSKAAKRSATITWPEVCALGLEDLWFQAKAEEVIAQWNVMLKDYRNAIVPAHRLDECVAMCFNRVDEPDLRLTESDLTKKLKVEHLRSAFVAGGLCWPEPDARADGARRRVVKGERKAKVDGME